MKRIKTLKLIIALLLLVNIGQLAFFFLNHKSDNRKGVARAEAVMQERFGFDERQMNLFIESRNKHRFDIGKLNRTLEELSLAYYSSIDEKQQSVLLDSILTTSAAIYARTHDHFDDIRAICTQEQLSQMDGFIKDLMSKNKRRKPIRKPKKRF